MNASTFLCHKFQPTSPPHHQHLTTILDPDCSILPHVPHRTDGPPNTAKQGMSHGRHKKKGHGQHHHHGTALGPLGFLPPGILPSSFAPPGASSPISTAAAAAAAAAAFPLPGFDAAAAKPEEQTCVAESWQAITGPDALLPDEYVRLPLDELQPVFESDLRRLADKSVNPRERCRLAHYLGNFSCTASGARMYEKAAWYVPTLYGIVAEIKDIYVSGAVVPRPCVAGYAMLALTSIVKQSMRVPFPTSLPPSSGRGHGHHHNGPHAVIDYMLGPLGGDQSNGSSSSSSNDGSSGKQQRRRVRGKQQQQQQLQPSSSQYQASPRIHCLWTLLKHVTAETARSRGALRTLSCTLELLTVLELACMGRNSALALSQDPSLPPSSLASPAVCVRTVHRGDKIDHFKGRVFGTKTHAISSRCVWGSAGLGII